MTSEDSERLFARFVADHPEMAAHGRWVELPDGSREFMITTEAVEAFARWSLFNGLGDARKIIDFLAVGLPDLKVQLARKFSALKPGAPAPEAPS